MGLGTHSYGRYRTFRDRTVMGSGVRRPLVEYKCSLQNSGRNCRRISASVTVVG